MKQSITHLLFAAGIACTAVVNAQTMPAQVLNEEQILRCGQTQYENYLRSKDPDYDKKKADAMRTVEKGIEKMQEKLLKGETPHAQYTLPVVFHVIWNTAAQNVSDAQVTAMLAQANMDWSRTNTDAGNTPSSWLPVAANTDIQFCLATKDPSGNTTTGIVHKQTSTTSFSTNDNMKYSAQGGDDAWDVTKYLNIWICNLSGGILGFANFPPASSNYGTVLHYITIGSLTNPNPSGGSFGYGRTFSHEVGHNFTLQHIWDGGCPAGGDGVTDTPGQQSPTSGCPSGVKTDGCQASAPGIMYQNYMDYTDDLCYNLFTTGQKNKCQSTVASYLTSVANAASTNCNVAPPSAVDAGISSIVTPNGTICASSFTPVVTLKNYGANVLTSCTINYKIDNNPNQTFSWTGNLASNATTNVTLPNMTTTAGTHTFTSSTTASGDGNPGNDQSTSTFNSASSSMSTPVQEPFASATPFPPTGWTVNNPDGATTWAYSFANFPTSSGGSMYMDNYDYNANGQKDEFVSNPVSMANATSAQVTFQLAYQMYSDPATYMSSDSLRIYVSTDCGVTWNNAYTKAHTALITVTPQFSTTEFTPSSAGQWRQETVSLNSYLPAQSMLVKFHQTTDYENNLYVDDINITSVVGINDADISNYISVYPNPSTGMVNVVISASNFGNASIIVTNLLGEVVAETGGNTAAQSKFSLNIEAQSAGVYFVKVKTDSGSAIQKVMLNK